MTNNPLFNPPPDRNVETVVEWCLSCGMTHRVKVWIPEEYGDWCKVEDWTYDPDDGANVYQHYCDIWETALRDFNHEIEMWRLKLKGFAERPVKKPTLADLVNAHGVQSLQGET